MNPISSEKFMSEHITSFYFIFIDYLVPGGNNIFSGCQFLKTTNQFQRKISFLSNVGQIFNFLSMHYIYTINQILIFFLLNNKMIFDI